MAKPVAFTRDSAERIVRVVREAERGDRNIHGKKFRTAHDGSGDPVRVGKTTSEWPKGTLADIDLYEEGTPPSETKNEENSTLTGCVNKFVDVEADRWVIVALARNGKWYLISAEC